MKKRNVTGKPAPRKFDLTDRREVEERLRRSEEKYRRIFENIQDIYYEVGLDGAILEISPSIERYSPFRREDLIGRFINEFYADQTQRNFFLQAIMERGSVHDFEIQLQDSRGSLFTCSITAALLPGSEALPPRIVGSMRDISARKQAEQALREREEELSIQSRNLEELNVALKVLLRQREEDRLELQEQVLVNVKTLILPCIAKLKEGALTPPQRDCLNTLEARITEIISPFLRRINQAYFDLTPQEIRVAECVKNGHATKEIATMLRISVKTVDYHRDHIRRKLGLRNRHASLRSFLLNLS
ncbi:MAG: PAS domain S-box protein [Deltaproteobacteria bacterium]|nr:PAS domain S-box protein [Deltaproteobacteria bacterium]